MIRDTPDKVLFIGCGGTGSYLAPLLANIAYTKEWESLGVTIDFWDPDKFQNRNKARQNFQFFHSGKNKATSLASSFDTAEAQGFGIAANKYNLDNWSLQKPLNRSDFLWVIVCTDNNAARLDTLEWLLEKTAKKELDNWFWVSPGNDDNAGQVFSQLCSEGVLVNQDPRKEHPSLLDGRDVRLRDNNSYGCGVTVESGSQSMLANNTAAYLTARILMNLSENNIYIPEMYFNVEPGMLVSADYQSFEEINSLVDKKLREN